MDEPTIIECIEFVKIVLFDVPWIIVQKIPSSDNPKHREQVQRV